MQLIGFYQEIANRIHHSLPPSLIDEQFASRGLIQDIRSGSIGVAKRDFASGQCTDTPFVKRSSVLSFRIGREGVQNSPHVRQPVALTVFIHEFEFVEVSW